MGSNSSKQSKNAQWWKEHEFSTTSSPLKYRESPELEQQLIDKPIPVYMVHTEAQLRATNDGRNFTLIIGAILSAILSIGVGVVMYQYQDMRNARRNKQMLAEMRNVLAENRKQHAELLALDRTERARTMSIGIVPSPSNDSDNLTTTMMTPAIEPPADDTSWMTPSFWDSIG